MKPRSYRYLEAAALRRVPRVPWPLNRVDTTLDTVRARHGRRRWKAAKGWSKSVIRAWDKKTLGDDLLSHQLAVPSAREGLTSVFGTGTGGTPLLRSPSVSICTLWRVGRAMRWECSPEAQGDDAYGQASRGISTGRLNTLPCVDLQPIDQIICLVSSVSTRERG